MRYVAVTLKGAEDLASAEIKSSLKAQAEKVADGRLLFSAKSLKGFSPRLVSRVYSYMGHFSFSSLKDLVKKSSKLKFSFKGSFVVRCNREGVHNFSSRDVERDVGEVIYHKGFKVDLKKPRNTVVADVVGNSCFIGVLISDNLCRRPYRVKIFSSSINACLAAAAVRFSSINGSDVVLDPFCKDGVIPIEASILGCKKVFAFDESMNNVRNAKINAKLANVKVNFSKCNADSLDLKLDEDSVDKLVTFPPFPSKKKKQSSIESLYKEFFYQISPILKKSGTLTIISVKPELILTYAKRSGFKILREKDVFVSNNNFKIVVFKKG
ncbi:MAG: THUMP domain-containing protein [archaeon]